MKTLNYTPTFWDTTPGACVVGAIIGTVAMLLIAGLAMVMVPESITSWLF
jgi:hypothetical protein